MTASKPTGFRQSPLADALAEREAADGHRHTAEAHASEQNWIGVKAAREREATALRAAAAGLRAAALEAEQRAVEADNSAFVASENRQQADRRRFAENEAACR